MAFGSVDKIVNYRYKTHGVSQTRSAMQNLSRAAVGIATAAAAAGVGLFKLADSLTQTAAHVEDLSRSTGVAASDLAALGYISEQDGGSLDALANGIRRMTRTVDDANDGLTTYIRSFEAIGINAENLRGMAPEEQFYVIAEAIAQMDDDSQRLAISLEIFGRAAMNLIPTLNRGEEGLRDMAAEARELGIALDDEAYEKSKQFQDALTELQAKLQGALLDAIQPMLPDLLEMAERIGDLATEYIPQLIEAMNDAIPVLGKFLDAVSMAIDGWGRLTRDSLGEITGLAQAVTDAGFQARLAQFGFWEMAGSVEGARNRTVDLIDAGWDLVWGQDEVTTSIESTAAAAGSATEEIQKYTAGLKELVKVRPDTELSAGEQAMIDAAQKRQTIVMETGRMQIEQANATNDIMIRGAEQFARALRGGGEDMLRFAVQIGLELAKAQLGKNALGGFGGPLFGFLGGLI